MTSQNRQNNKGARNSGNSRQNGGYSSGNGNWNTNGYAESVRTSRTDTRVMNSETKRRTYYYDNTPDAVKARRKKRIEETRREFEKVLRKSVRGRKIKSSFVYITSMFLAIATVVGVLYYFFFTTSQITVTGESSYSDEEIISASELTPKTHLYSFSSKKLSEKVSFFCPRISFTEVSRSAPNKVTLSVVEEEAAFYTVIYGEVYYISPTLRVLEKTEMEEAEASGLGRLKLKKVSKAVSGSAIELCSDRAQRYLENTVALVNESEFKGRVNCIDMSDEFNITMDVDGLYRLKLGTQDELEVKLKLAAAVLKDKMFESGNKAYIDLTDTSKTSVIVDNQLVIG